jgi:predicted HTH domain antitoxin
MTARTVRVHVEVPEEIGDEAKAAAETRAHEAAVLALWESGKLSASRAAEELGLSAHGFLDLLAARGLPVERRFNPAAVSLST